MRKSIIIFGLIFAVIIIFCLVPLLNVSTVYAYVCENTGSKKGHTSWIIGIQTDEWYTVSELEIFIKNNDEYELIHDWTNTAGTGRDLFGVSRLFGHGTPGPIYFIPEPVLNGWVKNNNSKEVGELYNILQNGSMEQVQKRINEMIKWYHDKLKQVPNNPIHDGEPQKARLP